MFYLPAMLAAGLMAQPATPPPPPVKPPPANTAGGGGTAPKSGAAKPPTTTPPKTTPPTTTPPTTTPPTPGSTPPPPPPQAGGSEEDIDAAPQAPVDLSDTWGYSRSSGPTPRYVRRSSGPVLYAPNPIGFYSGVSVEGNQTPPNPVKETGTVTPVLTWTGFERTATGSRVFFQLSGAAAYKVSQQGGTITIRLRKTKINVRNNMRRLDLSYFKTPVSSVKVWRKGSATMATITLKRTVEPKVRMTKAAGSGYHLLVVEFDHRSAAPTKQNRPNVPADRNKGRTLDH